MALNGTMVKIQTVNLGTAQASITFSSIPQTYDDLLIKVSAREATTNSYELAVVINGSSSAIYNWRLLQGSGSTAISDARVSQTVGQAGVLSSSNSTASGFGKAELYFPK